MSAQKVKKIGFVHTGVPIGMMIKELMAEHLPTVPLFHIVDDSLIQERLCAQIVLARDAGADTIMVTCSSIAPGVDFARKLVNVPVMKIDEPMAEKAVAMADTVGVLATAKTTFVPSVNLIGQVSEKMKKPVKIVSDLVSEAFDCFLSGDMQNQDRLVMAAGVELAGRSDVLVLAQASMSHLAEAIAEASGTPVLTSPLLAIQALKKIIE